MPTRGATRGTPFHKGWSEKYGFHVAESLALLSASLFAFTWIAESYVVNASLNRWDARFNHWLNHEAWPPPVRAFERVTIRGSGDVRGARERAAVLAALVGLLVAIEFSRIYLGAHSFSDVLAGISLGTAWLMVCVLGINAAEHWLRRPSPARPRPSVRRRRLRARQR